MNSVNEVLKKLQKIDPSIQGSIRIVNKKSDSDFQVSVACVSAVLTKDVIAEVVSEVFKRPVTVVGKVSKPVALIVVEEDEETKLSSIAEENRNLDDVNVLYTGFLPVAAIRPRLSEEGQPVFKKRNPEKFKNIEDCIRVFKFFSPLILDANLRVIDGQSRLEMATDLLIESVPVVITDADPVRAAALSLVLNRTSEFQRWIYSDIDNFLDTTPQAQPLLEPIGFFGEKLLPISFFAKTVLEYDIDEYNPQQQLYKQEMGLVEWARAQRDRIKAEDERKNSRRKPNMENDLMSLFDLQPQETDFVETFNPKAAARESLEEIIPQAARVTEAYDAKMKAAREAAGKPWQATKRSTKVKAKDLRAAAEAKVLLAADALLETAVEVEDEEVIEDDE